jgi:hypothetical protein
VLAGEPESSSRTLTDEEREYAVALLVGERQR